MRDLAAQPAPDAAGIDRRHRVGPQRIGIRLYGQRGASRKAYARVVAGANVVVDAEARAHDALARGELLGDQRSLAALAGELAFAVGDDDLESRLFALQRLAQRPRHRRHAVTANRPQPLDAERLDRRVDAHVGRLVAQVFTR